MPVRMRSKHSEPVSGPDIPGEVEPNAIVDLKTGDLISDSGDVYLVTTGREVEVGRDDKGKPIFKPEVRAWPKALWSLVSDVKSKDKE